MKKNNLFYLSFILIFAACAGHETYEEKMSRYSPKHVQGNNSVPKITLKEFQFKKSEGKHSNTKSVSEESTLSNKKLYFITLFNQYESLKKIAPESDAPSFNICPNFHNALIDYKKKPHNFSEYENKFSYTPEKFNNLKYVSTHPEFFLPISEDENSKNILAIFSKEKNITDEMMDQTLKNALGVHLKKMHSELHELCENGTSDNYYIYENLITHIKNNEFKPLPQNMNALLKTTVFYNMALLTSLLNRKPPTPSRGIASLAPKNPAPLDSSELLERLNVSWASEYYQELIK